MRISKKQYNEIVAKLESLEKTINKGGGNPYHDELGRFAESPVKAFGEYKADNNMVYGPNADYKGGGGDHDKENDRYRPFTGAISLADNDIRTTMTKEQADATMQTMGALRKMEKDAKKLKGDEELVYAVREAIHTLMGYTYTVGYRSSHGSNPEPGEWSNASWRTYRLDETTSDLKALQAIAKAAKTIQPLAKAATSAFNTMKYIDKNTKTTGPLHVYSVSKKSGLTEREIDNSLSNKADNLIAKMDRIINGGRGSGNFGHSGRPGKVGGSGPKGLSGNLGERSSEKKIESYQEKALANLGFSDVDKMTEGDWEKVRDEMTRLIAERKAQQDYEESNDRQKDETRRQNLEQARSEYYRDYLKYEKTDDGQYVRKKPDSDDKAYKESLAKIKSLTEEIRKSDAKSDDLQTQKDNVKIDRIEEKIGKKALLVAKDFEGSSLSTFMDEDGNEYWYDKRSERVKDYGGNKEYRSPAFDKAMKDKTPWNEYEITGAQIKSKLKGYGINTDGLSISKGRGGYETAWHISGSGLKTDLKAVEDIVKTKIGHVDYDERSGEILAGGNTYVFVSDKDR